MPKKKTLDDFLNELKEFPDYEYLEGFTSYSRAKVKMRHNCEKCGNHEFEVVPKDFISEKTKRRCDICSGSRVNTASFKWFIKEHGLENEYEVLGEVVDNKTKVKMRHLDKDCEDPIFEMAPDKFKSGSRCHNCANKKRSEATKQFMTEYYKTHNNPKQKSHEQFLSEVDEINKTLPDGEWYQVVGTYNSSEEHVDTIHHLPDGSSHIFDMHPNHFINGGTRCKVCNGNNFIGTEDFSKRVISMTNGEYMVVPGSEYKGSDEHIEIQHICDKCNNHKWLVTPTNFTNGRRCPICACNKTSRVEKEIYDFVKAYNRDIIENDRSVLDGKEIDIFISDINIGIEFDGLFWHSSKYLDRNAHLNKTNMCNFKGIQLIHIFEDEWKNKEFVVRNKLANLLKSKSDIPDTITVSNTEDRKFIMENSFCTNYSNVVSLYIDEVINGSLLYDVYDNKIVIRDFVRNTHINDKQLFNILFDNLPVKPVIQYTIDRRWEIYDTFSGRLRWNSTKLPVVWYCKDDKIRILEDQYIKLTNTNRYVQVYDCGYINMSV